MEAVGREHLLTANVAEQPEGLALPAEDHMSTLLQQLEDRSTCGWRDTADRTVMRCIMT